MSRIMTCFIEKTDGFVAQITLSPFRYESPGEEDFLRNAISTPEILGRVADVTDPEDVAAAIESLRARPRIIMPLDDVKGMPLLRFDCLRLNAARDGLEDDTTLTSEQEMAAACDWKGIEALVSQEPTDAVSKKILFGRMDMLTPEEREAIVKEWRKSDKCPKCSRFEPPAGAKAPPALRKA